MAVGDIVNTFEGDSVQKQQSGSFYNGHKVINDPIHVNYNNLTKNNKYNNSLFRAILHWTTIQ